MAREGLGTHAQLSGDLDLVDILGEPTAATCRALPAGTARWPGVCSRSSRNWSKIRLSICALGVETSEVDLWDLTKLYLKHREVPRDS